MVLQFIIISLGSSGYIASWQYFKIFLWCNWGNIISPSTLYL